MINLGNSGIQVPTVAIGCMRINRLEPLEAKKFVKTALANGTNFFDHANIYGGGACEEIFADAVEMSSHVRQQLIIQSKCGIRHGIAFDFSKEHILSAVDGSLKRLRTDYLDVLLLHRPDALVEPEEVADAFETLHTSGKVKFFGVSNHSPAQIQLLQRYVKQPIIANQLQLSITHAPMIVQGLHVNMSDDQAINRDGGVLDFCRLNDITIQPWSPLQYGLFEGTFLGNNQKFRYLNETLNKLAAQYNVSSTTIAIAWLLRHPAHMQPVIGTMNIGRLEECTKAAEITLTREEWYLIYLSAGNILP
jgi:predicted oxidoreductase